MTIPLGRPIIIKSYKHKGCLQRVAAQLVRVGVGLALVGSGLLMGYILWGMG